MRPFAILLAAALVTIPARAGFATAVTFRACSTSTAFACGKRDGAGQTYGTAHQLTRCTTLTFAPDGTVRIDDMGGSTGRYVRRGDRITITRPDGTVHATTRPDIAAERDHQRRRRPAA